MTFETKKSLFADRIYPAVITPFTQEGNVNRDAMLALMSRCCDEGARGLFIGGGAARGFLLRHKGGVGTF